MKTNLIALTTLIATLLTAGNASAWMVYEHVESRDPGGVPVVWPPCLSFKIEEDGDETSLRAHTNLTRSQATASTEDASITLTCTVTIPRDAERDRPHVRAAADVDAN